MPRKKTETEGTPPAVEEAAPVAEPAPKPVAKAEPVLCGHINRHSVGLDKTLDNIACDKPKGHGGDHSGIHEEYVKQYDTKVLDGREVTTVLLVPAERRVEWGDMAGTPVKEIPRPEPPAPPTIANLEKRIRQLEKGEGWKSDRSLQQL